MVLVSLADLCSDSPVLNTVEKYVCQVWRINSCSGVTGPAEDAVPEDAEEWEGWEAGSTVAAAAASPAHINSPSVGMPPARLDRLPPHLAFPGVSSDQTLRSRPQSWAYCEAQTGRAPQHYFHVLGVAPGPRGLRWAPRQRLPSPGAPALSGQQLGWAAVAALPGKVRTR